MDSGSTGFLKMEKITIAFITAIASVFVAVLGYLFSKYKEREADWRRKKLEMYEELFNAISGIVKEDSTPEAQKKFATSCNTIGLIASVDVIIAIQEMQEASKTGLNHDQALTKLLHAVREDLGLPLESKEFTYRLWCSGTSDP
jgi:F0F1-type ATP synthase membrane subunit a